MTVEQGKNGSKAHNIPPLMTKWDKWKTISNSVSIFLIPVFIAFIANSYTKAINDSELRLKYLNLSIKILEQKPTPDNEAKGDGYLLQKDGR